MPSTYIDGNFVSYANCEDDGSVVEAQESGAAGDSAADEGAAAAADSTDDDSDGVDPCACVADNGLSENDDGTVTVIVDGVEYFYPAATGESCNTWD